MTPLAQVIGTEFGQVGRLGACRGNPWRSYAARAVRRAHLVQGLACGSHRALHFDAGAAAGSCESPTDASVIFVSERHRQEVPSVSGALTRSPKAVWKRCAACLPRNSSWRGEPHLRINSVNPGRMRTADACRGLSGRGARIRCRSPLSVTGAFLYLLSAASGEVLMGSSSTHSRTPE